MTTAVDCIMYIHISIYCIMCSLCMSLSAEDDERTNVYGFNIPVVPH